MRVWLVKLGEPLPLGGNERLHRTGLLAQELAAAGHEVTYWTSSFNHSRKVQQVHKDSVYTVANNLKIRLLYTRGYSKNRSIARVMHDRSVAKKFTEATKEVKAPDIILASFPTPELCNQVARYALKHKCPYVVDVRDLWPDAIVQTVPKIFQSTTKYICNKLFPTPYQSLRSASAIFATSDEYLQWALRAVGRKKNQNDSVFHIGYPKTNTRVHQLEALRFWNSLNVDPDSFVICFFGSLSCHYDFKTLFGAIEVLENTPGISPTLIMCGSGDYYSMCKKAEKKYSSMRVLGWVNQPIIQEIMRRSSVGIAPYAENAQMSLPNKPFEYFSAGLPIVSSLKGELAQLIDSSNAGINYKAGEEQSLVHALCALNEDIALRKAMSSSARMAFEKHYAANIIYPKFASRLEEIACAYTEKLEQAR